MVKCESAKLPAKSQIGPEVLSLSSKTDISYVRVIMARIVKSLHDLNEKRLGTARKAGIALAAR